MFVSTKSTRGVCNNVVKIMVIAKKIHKNLVSLEPHEFAIFFEKKIVYVDLQNAYIFFGVII